MAVNKYTSKSSSSNPTQVHISPAQSRAKEMESGFVKSKKKVVPHTDATEKKQDLEPISTAPQTDYNDLNIERKTSMATTIMEQQTSLATAKAEQQSSVLISKEENTTNPKTDSAPLSFKEAPHSAPNTHTQENKKEVNEKEAIFSQQDEELLLLKNKKNKKNKKEEKSGYQLTLSPSACITILVTSLVTVSFVFLFGLIIGKGMVPAPIKAEPEKFTPPMETQAQAEANLSAVLPKEELQFLTNLKTDDAGTEDPVKAEQAAQQALLAQTQLAQQAQNTQGSTNSNIAQNNTQNKIYDYNIRVASFRAEAQADKLREKLEGAGFRTVKIKDKDSKGSWFYVHVRMRASEAGFRENVKSFKSFAIRDYIVKDKKVVQ